MYSIEIDREDSSAVVGEQSGERSTHNFASIDDRDRFPKRARTIRKENVVHLTVLEDFDDRERCTGKNSFNEGAILIGDGGGSVDRGGRREGELARIDEAGIVVERKEPRLEKSESATRLSRRARGRTR